MFGVPATSEFDLRFRLLRIPVRVTPWFWIIAALLGPQDGGVREILIWVGCVLFSVLVHEFGHGLMARAFGDSPSIVLHTMGGLCFYDAGRQTAWQRLAVLFCGPGAGFLLAGLVYYALGYLAPAQGIEISPLGRSIGGILIYINIFWGLLNLMPIWPLDGGQMASVVLAMLNRRRGARWAHVLSLVTAGLLAAFFLSRERWFMGLFFVYFAFVNYQALQAMYDFARQGFGDDADWWKR